MAERRVRRVRETFTCVVCLDLLKDPVSTLCGHSYCLDCLRRHWDGEDGMKIYSCPQCRVTFTSRPALRRNTMLENLIKHMMETALEPAPADHCCAGPEDVSCAVCTESKLKTHNANLVSLVSYWDQHIQPHYDGAALEKLKLVEPSENLQENICSRHDEVKKMFCRTDKQCICYLCSVEEHRGHVTVSAAVERTERQKELEGSREHIQRRIQDREKDGKLFRQELETINRSANKVVKENKKVFTDMIHLLEKRRSEVEQQVRSQQKSEVSRVKELQEKLEQEITELKRKDAEMKKLSDIEDHNQFLQNYYTLSPLGESTDSPSLHLSQRRFIEHMKATVSGARDKIHDSVSRILARFPAPAPDVDVPRPNPPPGSQTRAEFLKYSQEIALDPNTANPLLLLSERNRKATLLIEKSSCSSHPDRFTECRQVLSREGLTGRCYWEVEWGGRGVQVAVAYKNISRAVSFRECAFGLNDQSWALDCYRRSFLHNRVQTPVPGPVSSRVGVDLDHSAGTLSFYSVSDDTMTLLHRVQTMCTQPLHAGFGFYCCGSTAKFRKVK
ncbi:E3 ubiquitin/ISG15 ligase TRIM25-like [Etheostoma cragini]|uniref:E3 ubiquitin/ISG15 ligase TRIM25-like n=1 Tax=Etheostoma cragini TaxID=417921 RepID=UPI00155EAD41|nr:E3 ubiquitin/ISG15 ligase TRIM25-like [Etheostoma cragini]